MLPINVLCVSEYFLPGFRGGGPTRTLKNIPLLIGNAVTFSYLTRDRDLGCTTRYAGIEPDRWYLYPYGRVFHATEQAFGLAALSKALDTSEPDLIYLNSFFGFKSSISIVIRNWIKPYGKPILLAPRGEFSLGALALKSRKKRAFIALARAFRIYKAISWHASTEQEREDILRKFPEADAHIFTAEDPVDIADVITLPFTAKVEGLVRLVFISRIASIKNLDGLLQILHGVSCRINLTIFGPIEDELYWQRCGDLIRKLPLNVSVKYAGELTPEKVHGAFSQADLFAFPTKGENFGHVIFESLRAGTPVLVSDQTPWKADMSKALVERPLDSKDTWRAEIEAVGKMTDAEQQEKRSSAVRYAQRFAANDKTRVDNLKMFEAVARFSKSKGSK